MSEPATEQRAFGRIRSLLWPIHSYELKKLVPMLFIFFLISFDYNVLRTMKDTLVVTARSSGAEIIPFIKVWVMFPGALLMTFLFTRFSNYLTSEKVFYTMMSVFLGFFALFTWVLYPMQDLLHPHAHADTLQASLPQGFKGLIAMYRNWTFTLFYAMSELWGNIILFVLFWGFANQVTRICEAKRFYGLFGIGANFSGIFAGQVSVYVTRHTLSWESSLSFLVLLVIVSGIAAMGIFRWMHRSVLTDPRFYDPKEAVGEKKKLKLSMRDSFRYLLDSKYLVCIAFLMIGYNVVINLVEVVWKHELRLLYPNPNDYNLYMNQVSTCIGVVATLTALFVSGNAVRKGGWTFTALLTPVILLVTCTGFFTFFFFKNSLHGFALTVFGMTPLGVVVLIGSIQNILCRAAKYTVFDATKEMAFIPLSQECKLKGKAAIDGVCSRLGKSGGSLIHQTFLVLFSTITASSPYVLGCLLVTISFWVSATFYLGKAFNQLTAPPLPKRDGLLEEGQAV